MEGVKTTGTLTRQSASVVVLFTYVEYGFITGCFIKVLYQMIEKSCFMCLFLFFLNSLIR